MADTEVDFVSCCPVSGCSNNNRFTKLNWTHNNCGGYEKLNGLGNLRCIRCGTSGPIIDWKFRCESHEYKKSSQYGLMNMLAIFAEIETNNKENTKFINSLTRSILKMQLEINEDDCR